MSSGTRDQEKRNKVINEIIHFCLELTITTSIHVSLAKATYVATPNFNSAMNIVLLKELALQVTWASLLSMIQGYVNLCPISRDNE